MAQLPLRPCLSPGCPALVRSGYCAACQIARGFRHFVAPPRLSRHVRGYGAAWDKIRRRQLERHPWCRVCGKKATDVDHIVPRALGGSDEESNLQSLCHAHHSRKTAKETQPWKRARD